MTDLKKYSSAAITRRSFLRGSIALGGASVAWSGIDAWCQPTPASSSYVEVETMYGRLRGAQGNGLLTFKGIPYGGSVSGANRFKAAPALQPWTGVREALEFGAGSLQSNGNRTSGSEDCLFLNIWTPAADGRKRPVMFYNHGGGFTTGSAAATYQDGGNLARTWDVVVVATNHRLGLMGYLYLGELGGDEYATSGNQGLLDIRDGLKWVHDNIERFGGDPDNVMIFGESGGGAKTSCLYAMPSAGSYFNKASIESGPGIRITPRDSAAATAALVLKELGLEKSEWRKLLEVAPAKLVDVQVALGRNRSAGPLTPGGGRRGMSSNANPGGFGPVLDGQFMPNHPFDPIAPAISKNKPLMVGYNRDEMNFFFAQNGATDVYSLTDDTLKERLEKEQGASAAAVLGAYRKSRPNASQADLYVAISTARFAVIGSTTIAERKYSQHGAPVFMYCFTHESERMIPGTQHIYGAAHAVEIVYKFNNVPSVLGQQQSNGGGGFADTRPESIRAAHNMSELWSTFARTGHPAAKGQPAWPAYDTSKRATMFIDAECKVINDPFSPERRVWDQVDPA
jgi:para-nitrobenzyl esterase